MATAPLEEHTEPWFIDRDDRTLIHFFTTAGNPNLSSGKICPFPFIAFEQNLNSLFDFVVTDNNEQVGFNQKVAITSGSFIVSSEVVIIPAIPAFTLAEGKTNFLEINTSGAIISNTLQFTPGNTPLAEIVVSNAGIPDITSLTDKRPWLDIKETCATLTNGGLETIDIASCGNPSANGAKIPKFRLEFTEPLPDDFNFASGSVSRFSDRLSLVLEEFTPSRVEEPAILVGQNNSLPTETFIARYDFINVEILGVSDGEQAQTFSTSGDEIKSPTKGTATIQAGSETFTVIADILTAGPNDTVFEYDETTGDVIFGDGVNGAIPESGQKIILKITIRNGGGQWKFAGIVNSPKSAINIGNVKSVKDQIFYSQAEINMASQSGFTTVTHNINTGTLNFYNKKVADEPPARILLGRHVYHRPTWGTEILAIGGTITLYKTGGAGYVNPNPKAKDPFTVGLFAGIPFKALEIDTSAVYPSIKATVSGLSASDVSVELSRTKQSQIVFPPLALFQGEDILSGVITSPKEYDDTITLVNPNTVSMLFSHTADDLTTVDYLEWSISRILEPIIAPGYELRLIQMGDKIGDFDNPVDTTSVTPVVVFNEFTGKISVLDSNGNFDSGETWVGKGRFETNVSFSLASLATRLIMKYEGRLTNERKAYLTHIGSPIPPNFICEWKFELTNVASFDRPEDPL